MILPADLPAKPTFRALNISNVELPSKPRTGNPKRKIEQRKEKGKEKEAEEWCTPWVDNLPMTEYENKEQRLHDEIVAFAQYLQATPEDVAAREKIVKRLTELIQRRFWNCEVKIFGSAAQGLALPGGDIDITIHTPQVSGEYHRKQCLFELSRMLRDSSFSDKPFVVANARVPILTFETRAPLGEVKFDININSDDGYSMIPLIKGYLDTLPALRPLLLLVKAFLARRGLNSAANSGLGSYATTLLIISFLQLRPGDRPPEVYDRPMESESLGLLLIDFFEYYADKFPYETSYISVLHSGLLPKESKGWLREKQPDALSIESIVDTAKDVGRICGKIGQVRAAFREAFTALKEYPFSATTGNVLGSVIGLANSTIQHRKRLSTLVQSGDLDKALADVSLPPQWGAAPSLRRGPRDIPPHRDAYQRDQYRPSNSGRQPSYRPRADNRRPYPDMAPHYRQHPYTHNSRQHSSDQPYRRSHCPW